MTAQWQRQQGDLDRRSALKLTLVGASALLMNEGGTALAADGEKMIRTTVTRLLENDRIEVVRMVSAPGSKGAMKGRPDRLLYILKGAKIRLRYPSGKTEDAVWKTGDVVYQKADERQVENIDANNLEYLSVHLK